MYKRGILKIIFKDPSTNVDFFQNNFERPIYKRDFFFKIIEIFLNTFKVKSTNVVSQNN